MTGTRRAGASLLVHDAGQDDPSYAFALSRLDSAGFAHSPIGIFRICRKTGAAVASCRLGVDHRFGSVDVRVGRPPHGVADGLAGVRGIAAGDTVGDRGVHDGLRDHRR